MVVKSQLLLIEHLFLDEMHIFCRSTPDSMVQPQLSVAENHHFSGKKNNLCQLLVEIRNKTIICPTLDHFFTFFSYIFPWFSPGFSHPFRVDLAWPRRQVDHEAPHALWGCGAPVPGDAAAQVVGVQVLEESRDKKLKDTYSWTIWTCLLIIERYL